MCSTLDHPDDTQPIPALTATLPRDGDTKPSLYDYVFNALWLDSDDLEEDRAAF
jgi:hypothetical protein